jgi:hypothetical protein
VTSGIQLLGNLLARRYEPKAPASKLVAIVVPLSLRTELSPDEQISMRHLLRYFGKYDKFMIAPKGQAVHFDGFQVKYFSRKYFGSGVAHNRLTYAPHFYKAFENYRFIFFYHLDSLAFSDQLPYWCDTDLDYIGAPWLNCQDTPWVDRPRVGNGGFTLLRTESALKVLANRYRQEPNRSILDFVDQNARLVRPAVNLLAKLKSVFHKSEILDRILSEWDRIERPTQHGLNNDLFWADQAIRYLPSFKIATVEEGLRFAFEASPRSCYEMNHQELPFGCHAWAKFDRSFWEPHLLVSDEHKASVSVPAR